MRHETHTYLTRDQVFAAAKQYFGADEGGLGMKKGAEQGSQIQFFGDGLVWITVWPAKAGATSFKVDIDVSERDADAKAFIDTRLKARVAPAPTRPDAK